VSEGVLLVSNVFVKSVLRNKFDLIALLVAVAMLVANWRTDNSWSSQDWLIPFWVAVTPFIARRIRPSHEGDETAARQKSLTILIGATLVQLLNLGAWRFAEIPMRNILPVAVAATFVQMGALVYLYRWYAKARTPRE